MSKSKPPVSATEKRRELVRKYVFDKGITSKTEIMKLLEKEHGISVRRETVDGDFKSVTGGGIPSSRVVGFHLDLISIYRKRIRELDRMISDMGDVMKKATLMRAQSQIMKDMGQVTRDMAEVEDGRWIGKSVKKGKESVSILFEE